MSIPLYYSISFYVVFQLKAFVDALISQLSLLNIRVTLSYTFSINIS